MQWAERSLEARKTIFLLLLPSNITVFSNDDRVMVDKGKPLTY